MGITRGDDAGRRNFENLALDRAGTRTIPAVYRLVNLAGGIGVLLPVLTGILPWPTVLAALGCMGLQVLAIGFHASRGELALTPFNFFLLASARLCCGAGTRRIVFFLVVDRKPHGNRRSKSLERGPRIGIKLPEPL